MSRYNNLPILTNNKKQRYISGIKYPHIPLDFSDIYVITTVGDRFDILAQQYYNDSSLWWVISRANPQLKQDSYNIPGGLQIRIPQNFQNVVDNFNRINRI